jgi:hypothetical protein
LLVELREGEWKKEGARGLQTDLEAGPELLTKEDWEWLWDSSEGEGNALPGNKGEKPLNELDEWDMMKVLRRNLENYLK